MLEDGDEGRSDEIPFFAVLCLKDVEADGVLRIGRIEIHHFICPARGDEMQKVFDELAVRVNHAYAVAATHILYRHILEKGRFARPSLADDINVLAAVIRLYPELDAACVRDGFPQSQNLQNKKGLPTLYCTLIFIKLSFLPRMNRE